MVREGWNPFIEVHVYAGPKSVVEKVVRHILNTDYTYPDMSSLINACPGLRRS